MLRLDAVYLLTMNCLYSILTETHLGGKWGYRRNVRVGQIISYPSPTDWSSSSIFTATCEKLRLNFRLFPWGEMCCHLGLFGKDSHLTFVLHHSVCIMSVSLLDHRLQHGCPGRTQRALCVLGASMDYPAQDHPAWGRCFSIPLLPAAAEPGRRRWIISSLSCIGPELFPI